MGVPARARGELSAQAKASPLARALLRAQSFIYTEQNGGLVLLAATALALFLANSPWRAEYFAFLRTPLSLDLSFIQITEDVRHVVNDGLMTLFFFVVGLEIKRELTEGELADFRRAALPIAAAIGGMVAPAAIYLAFNAGSPAVRGWGIPMATDIAFALGALALVGRGIPSSLRLFLLALAVVDDIGAILVIAVFYSANLALPWLAAAAAVMALILLLQRLGLRAYTGYVFLGIVFWLTIFESGIHATIAGVILGLVTPNLPLLHPEDFEEVGTRLVHEYREALDRGDEHQMEAILGEIEVLVSGTEPPVERLERLVHPWTSYVVLPLFALANAGVELSGELIARAPSSTVTLGVVAGLLVGKPLGVLAVSWLATRLSLAALPEGVAWLHLAGAAILAGIGFTVSLFIGDLAFTDPVMGADAKVGIFVASALAGALGFGLLRYLARREGAGA